MTTGGCYCGAVRYRFEGGVMWPGLCHCAVCRKFSGAAGGAWFGVGGDGGFAVEGEVASYSYKSDSGNDISRAVCAKCRAPIYNVNSMMPDMHVIAAGSLDDPSVFAPRMRIYCGIAAPWALPEKEELPRFDAMPQKGGG